MNGPRVLVSFLLIVLAVLIQTTVFHSVRPFGVSPDVVLLAVIAAARWARPEIGVLLGFVGGLVLDMFGTAPLGLNALAFTLAAYMTVRIGDRFSYGLAFVLSSVGMVTFIGLATVALIGTMFGEGTLGSPGILKTLLLVPVYNMVLGLAVLPLFDRVAGAPSARYAGSGSRL